MTEHNGHDNGHDNGRDERGRFAPGNAGGPGCPYGAQTERFRSALMAAVTRDDMAAIARRLVADAKGGSVRAASLLFDRVLGKPLEAPDMMDRLTQLETALGLE